MQFGVSECVAHWGMYRPQEIAIRTNGRNVSYAELNHLIGRVCHVIRKDQPAENQRIGIAVSNKLFFLVALIAILRAGKSAVILNLGLQDKGIDVNLRDTGTNSIIYDQSNNRIAKLISDDERISYDIDDILARDVKCGRKNHVPEYAYRCPEGEWGILFSSGTTGVPKGIERDHNSMITELLGWILELGLNRSTKFFIGRPLFYTGGLVLALSSLLVSAETIINEYEDDGNHEKIWRDFQNELSKNPITWAFFIPEQIREFTKLVSTGTDAIASAENILAMGSPISGDEKKAAQEVLGSQVIESWGNSESLGTITDPDDLAQRPGSIGRPFLGDKMCIVNDNGILLAENEHGRIAGSEEAGFSKYSNRPVETSAAKCNDLIISDDIGYVDEYGYYYIMGRKQDYVVLDPEHSVYLPDIEKTIRSLGYVRECCVVSKSMKDSSVHLFGIVALEEWDKKEASDVLKDVNNTVPKHMQLTDICLVQDLPRVPSGKIDKIKTSELIGDR